MWSCEILTSWIQGWGRRCGAGNQWLGLWTQFYTGFLKEYTWALSKKVSLHILGPGPHRIAFWNGLQSFQGFCVILLSILVFTPAFMLNFINSRHLFAKGPNFIKIWVQISNLTFYHTFAVDRGTWWWKACSCESGGCHHQPSDAQLVQQVRKNL